VSELLGRQRGEKTDHGRETAKSSPWVKKAYNGGETKGVTLCTQ